VGGNERHCVCFTRTENIMAFLKVRWSKTESWEVKSKVMGCEPFSVCSRGKKLIA